MKVAILTTANQWFVPYAKALKDEITALFKDKISECALFFEHTQVKNFDIVFVLSYHKIIPALSLEQNSLVLVLHASNLPQGKGWSPFSWQILEGKDEICFSLFKAGEKVDSGEIYLQKCLKLNGFELYDELREKQRDMTKQMCIEFLRLYPHIKARAQKGDESFYPKRSSKDSELDLHKSLNEQFNLLRICSNDEFPAFFIKDGKKFVLKIYADDSTENINSVVAGCRGGGVILLCLDIRQILFILLILHFYTRDSYQIYIAFKTYKKVVI